MDNLILIPGVFYLASTAGYIGYLFRNRSGFHRAGHLLLWTGFVLHSLVLAAIAVKTARVPAANLHETLSVAGWALAGVFLFFQRRFDVKVLGAYAAPLVTVVVIAALHFPQSQVPLKTAMTSLWLLVHIATVFIGDAAFALAAGLGLLYLAQERAIKGKRHGFFFKRLPSLEQLDNAGYGCIVTGFAFLTFGLITGFVYAQWIWGRFWSWDPKEVWSSITWLLYAALLHQRLAMGWRGRRSAMMAMIGFAVVLFTFLGVNILLKGHHGEFTRW